jgi:hypothetical protein
MTLQELADRLDAGPHAGAGETGGVVGRLREAVRLLLAPIDFDALVAGGQLRRLSSTRYQVPAGRLHELPGHVWAQAARVEPAPGGPVLTFRRRHKGVASACPALLPDVRCVGRCGGAQRCETTSTRCCGPPRGRAEQRGSVPGREWA